MFCFFFFFSSRRRHTRYIGDWSSDVCSSDLAFFRHIVVAGEMLELGSAGPEMHRRAGSYIAEQKIDVLLGVRGLARSEERRVGKEGRVGCGRGRDRKKWMVEVVVEIMEYMSE